MVLNKEELLRRVNELIGETDSDENLTFLEDVSDTLNDLEAKATTDWKAKFDENDAAWRKRYRERFFNTPANGETDAEQVVADNEEDIKEESKEKTYDELFTEKDKNSGY